MKQQILSLLLVVISILGLLDASYVTYEEFSGAIPFCTPPFQCAVVLGSQYSQIAGVPISVFGMFFYATMFVLAILNVTEVKITIPVIKSVRNAIYLLSAFGFGFSLYLISLMQFVIGAWCLWCLISATTSISLFIVAMLLRKSEQRMVTTE